MTIDPTVRIQPPKKEVKGLAICFDHWYTDPASGYWRASSAKQSATSICPTSTAGQVQIHAGPPDAKPKKNSSNTPVMIEM